MSKDKKQNPKEEPVKLDMSFEDAIRLAMKTSPAMQIELIPNVKTEIKGAGGRVIELISVTVYNNPDEDSLPPNASNFYIDAEIKSGSRIVYNTFVIPPNIYQKNLQKCEFYKPQNRFPTISVNNAEVLFLTLKPLLGNKNNVKFGILDYVSHLKSKI